METATLTRRQSIRLLRWGRLAILLLGPLSVAEMAVAAGEPAAATAEPAEQLEFFERHVRPLLAERCSSCHGRGDDSPKGGLSVDSLAKLLTGGDSGPAIVPGDPDGSLLLEAVRYESYEMPPEGKLGDEEIAVLERWVRDGAVWPAEVDGAAADKPPTFDLQQRRDEHWAWQKPSDLPPPAVSDRSWSREPLDAFILASLETEGFQPAAPIDRAAFIRRLYFDLCGLPPTPQQLDRDLADDSPDAIERLVDRLLASPRFGERWGRHWLDLTRYAESRGHEFDADAPNAFRYRDYVIEAFNADVPYDRFVREHIAGDLLPDPRTDVAGGNRSVLGTGFWHLGEWVHSPVDILQDEADRFDNMIDVFGKTFLGLTIACARCHDHKFDAISTADYYALTGFLHSSDYRQVRFETAATEATIAGRLVDIDDRWRQEIVAALRREAIEAPPPAPLPSDVASHVLIDYSEPHSDTDWLQDGWTFGCKPHDRGTVRLLSTGGTATVKVVVRGVVAADPFWCSLQSVSPPLTNTVGKLPVEERAGRTLRTPTFELTAGRIDCRIRGGGHVVACVDSHRLINGPLHGETIAQAKADAAGVSLDLSRYVGHRIHLEFTPLADNAMEISRILVGANDDVLEQLVRYEAAEEASLAAYTAAVQATVEKNAIDGWATERADLQARLPGESAIGIAMRDGSGEDAAIYVRGNASRTGEEVPRRFLAAIAGTEPMAILEGSGRLQLADAVAAENNPLTYRVVVNRLWHHMLGRGLVATPDDFGVLGARPTHPQLLDHLAVRLLRRDRSLKFALRDIALSSTYRMGGETDPAAVAADPTNLLWHYRPPKRLEGEAIRDAILTAAGQLDSRIYGPSIPVHLTAFMDGRGRPKESGPLDGNCRRSIYTAVRRNFLPPFMLAFDAPIPFSSMGRRNRSNVPAQALILLNDPLVIELASRWSTRLVTEHPEGDARVEAMYRSALGRPPSAQERQRVLEFVGQDSPDRWRAAAQAVFNTKEFLFLR